MRATPLATSSFHMTFTMARILFGVEENLPLPVLCIALQCWLRRFSSSRLAIMFKLKLFLRAVASVTQELQGAAVFDKRAGNPAINCFSWAVIQ